MTGALGTPTKTYSYTYGDANWKDKLTAFDGKAITYDGIGNPLTYNGWAFTWEEGRQLAKIKNSTYDISFKYNSSGIRTEKKVNGVTTNYHLVGDKVTQETNGTDTIYYTYDSTGHLVSMNLNGAEYYYIRNVHGDIIGLFDKTGTQVVSYVYDSWGKLISISGSLKDTIGVKNPYRYRGYRYDTETGLYYLQSRYYSPEWGRFVNSDGIVGQKGELLAHNIFAYCANNSVNAVDDTGFLHYKIDNERGGGGGSGFATSFKTNKFSSNYNFRRNYRLKRFNYTRPFTKSNFKIGQQKHKTYKANMVLDGVKIKEFRLPSGKRIDYINFKTKTIYELKPYNLRSIKQGYKQLNMYKSEIENIYGGGWRIILDTY